MQKIKTLAGCGLSGLAVLVLIFDAVEKLLDASAVQETIARLGYALSLDAAAGVIELACIGLYVIPRTSAFGEMLLTGLFGEDLNAHAADLEPTENQTPVPEPRRAVRSST